MNCRDHKYHWETKTIETESSESYIRDYTEWPKEPEIIEVVNKIK